MTCYLTIFLYKESVVVSMVVCYKWTPLCIHHVKLGPVLTSHCLCSSLYIQGYIFFIRLLVLIYTCCRYNYTEDPVRTRGHRNADRSASTIEMLRRLYLLLCTHRLWTDEWIYKNSQTSSRGMHYVILCNTRDLHFLWCRMRAC